MWKSGIFLRTPTTFYPQPDCEKEELFNRGCVDKFKALNFHSLSFHIPQPLWTTVSVLSIRAQDWQLSLRIMIVPGNGGMLPLSVRAQCICCRYFPDPLGIVPAGQISVYRQLQSCRLTITLSLWESWHGVSRD